MAERSRVLHFGGVFSTALWCPGLYRDLVVARTTAASNFRITDLMNADAPASLYLVVPPSDLARSSSSSIRATGSNRTCTSRSTSCRSSAGAGTLTVWPSGVPGDGKVYSIRAGDLFCIPRNLRHAMAASQQDGLRDERIVWAADHDHDAMR